LRAQGIDRHGAIVAASTLRLRPVLMTALAAGAAMFPIAISPPPATEQFRNIATAISGGLITSTLMTLIVIPVAYSLMDDFVTLLRRVYLGPSEADTAEPVGEVPAPSTAQAVAVSAPRETRVTADSEADEIDPRPRRQKQQS
jgi:hypothetical protein